MTKIPDAPSLQETRTLLLEMLPSIADEVPSLVEEIIDDIRGTVPEYARPLDGPYGQIIRAGVKRNVTGFMDWLVAPDDPLDRRDEICRMVGALEAYEGRQLAVLQTAYRIGAQVSWHRIQAVLQRHEAPPEAVSALADALFNYMDEAADLSRRGYEDAKAQMDEEQAAARTVLLHALAERSDLLSDNVAELCTAAGWTIPDEVTLIALSPGLPVVRPLLDGDLLLDLDAPEPYLLVPGRLTGQRQETLQTALAETKAAAGLTVPVERAADSLRWARQALALVDQNVIDDGPLTLGEDHVVTLWLLSDNALVDQLGKRRLGFLAPMTDRQRKRLAETLRSWLRTRGPATRMSEDLGVHVQTVRYRMRRLEQVLGGQLDDPDIRFATEVVLRALWLRERAARAEGQEPYDQDPADDMDAPTRRAMKNNDLIRSATPELRTRR